MNFIKTLGQIGDNYIDMDSDAVIFALYRLHTGEDLDTLIAKGYLETWHVTCLLDDEEENFSQDEKDALNWLWGYIDGQTANTNVEPIFVNPGFGVFDCLK